MHHVSVLPAPELIYPVILLASVIQSLFGVGVLLLGTPWMLLLGMTFPATLQLLLPISLTISLLQLRRGHQYVDRVLLRGIATLTLPAIVVALLASTRWSPPLEIFVAILVLTFSLQDRVRFIRHGLNQLLRFQRTYLAMMGFVHGASNLGGSMLTALAFGKGLHRDISRATIAAGYTLFAVVQLTTLRLAGTNWQVDVGTGVRLIVVGGRHFG
ncbi:MAG: hypothetical protein CM1200mP14_21850 [Gammaproteobacteria bacterium]|nr:MAG: hypothetical protein CM1200mP14_21850 [Gammaproteobacteria bacterium]